MLMMAIVVLVLVTAVVAFLVISRGADEAEERRQILAAPRRTVAEAQPGLALRLVGAIRLQEPLKSPLSGRSCTWFRLVVRRGDETEPLLDLSEARDFELEDDTGRASIETGNAVEVVSEPAHTWYGTGGSAPTPELLQILEQSGLEGQLPGLERLDVYEHVLAEGATVVVYGFVDRNLEEPASPVVVHQAMRITDDLSLA